MPGDVTIRQARSTELGQAIALIFARLSEPARRARVDNILSMIASGEIDGRGVFVACADDQLCGATVCVPTAGASGLFWPPSVETEGAAVVEDQLLQTAQRWLRRRGAKLGQAILAPEDVSLAEPLLRNGFMHATSISYLKHSLDRSLTSKEVRPAALRIQTYREVDSDVFRNTLMESYVETLDCPELNGIRTSEDIIEGHLAAARHDTRQWWLAQLGSTPVAVLLLDPDPHSWQLSYIGVITEARRQGIGRILVQLSVDQACQHGAWELTVAVDDRNLPARKLYRQFGFQHVERREVFLIALHSEAV